jgi:hypothetical protein
MNTYTHIDKCPITGDTNGIKYFDLGELPLVNNLNDTKEESLNCPRYPLAVQLFEQSGLSALTVEVDPNILYNYYLYKSGVSQPYIEHCDEMFEFVNTYLNLTEEDRVLDIGGNDGTLLKEFLKKKSYLNVLNIDASANLTAEAQANGIPSINEFWGADLAKKLDTKFKLITTTNCFQHTAPIESFVEGILLSLAPRGIWCLEFPYWKTSLETGQFDQVYHEHVYYYLLTPLKVLLDKFNLQIIKAVHKSIHGGTMRLLISNKGKDKWDEWTPCDSVEETLNKEKFTAQDYIKWGENIKNDILKSKEFIVSLKEQGYKIAGFGAAAKGCIYLNAAGINHTHLEYILDDTNIKQGKFVPGTGIEIVSREALKTNPVDYIVILAHNFSDYIIKILKQDGYTGKIIILIPKIKVI